MWRGGKWKLIHSARMKRYSDWDEVQTPLARAPTPLQDKEGRDLLFRAIDTIPCVAKKARWAMKWIGSSGCFAERLVAYACVEVRGGEGGGGAGWRWLVDVCPCGVGMGGDTCFFFSKKSCKCVCGWVDG